MIDTIAATMDSHAPRLDKILYQLGQAGNKLSEMDAAEGAAGNISVCLRLPQNVSAFFPQVETIELPHHVPELAGMMLVVSGSGRRLRDIADAPLANLACVLVEPGGRSGKSFTSPQRQFQRVTSEFNSHLGVHAERMRDGNVSLHAVLHAQPIYLTALSHRAEYQDEKTLNRRLLRWQPETIANIPEGIGVIPFLMPGSAQLVVETKLALRTRQIVVWARHGVMARADESILHALDLIEYAETAAHYETLNLLAGGEGGLSPEEIREITGFWKIRQNIF